MKKVCWKISRKGERKITEDNKGKLHLLINIYII